MISILELFKVGHHFGMAGGLVQIPCIERSAFGAAKAINAASPVPHGDGTHRVSLAQMIATMRQTGADMHSQYKEPRRGVSRSTSPHVKTGSDFQGRDDE